MYILNLINNSKDIGFSTCSKKFDTYQWDLEYVDVFEAADPISNKVVRVIFINLGKCILDA
jgi:hypothetical protein